MEGLNFIAAAIAIFGSAIRPLSVTDKLFQNNRVNDSSTRNVWSIKNNNVYRGRFNRSCANFRCRCFFITFIQISNKMEAGR